MHYLLEYQHANSSNTTITPTNPQNINTKSILRGGHIDALIVLATSANASVHAATHPIKTSTLSPSSTSTTTTTHHRHHIIDEFALNKVNFLYQEAFLTTYRTILEPFDLINKLIQRYRLFVSSNANHTNMFNNTNNNKDNLSCADEKFDFNRLRLMNKQTKMRASAARNSLALLVRVVDDLEG